MEECIGDLKLNLGCGKVRWDKGWLNVDFEQGDLLCDIRALPADDNSVDAIAAIHVIEHFYRWEIDAVLGEWFRVLKPGGRIILELPSMDKVLTLVQRCLNKDIPLSPTLTWHALWGNPKDASPAMTHKWGYTQDMLRDILRMAGFAEIELKEARYHFPMRDMRLEAVKAC